MKVKYLYETKPFLLQKDKIYDVQSIEKGWYRIVDESGDSPLIRLDRHLLGFFAGAGIVYKIIAGVHGDQRFAVKDDGLQRVFLSVKFTQIGNGIHYLITADVLMYLQSAVSCRGEEHLTAEYQLEDEIRYFVAGVVENSKVVGMSLIIVLGQALVIKVEHLRPCAVASLRSDENSLFITGRVCGGEQL